MITVSSKKWRTSALGILMIFIWLGPIKYGKAAETGQQIFQSRCAACHTIGKGKLVGPDLAGVTSSREESWLKRQIKEPDRLIAEKDPIAMQLLQESNNMPMPSLGLSDADVVAIIAYLKSTERQAESTEQQAASTEQQANAATDLPSQYMTTVYISIGVLVFLTLIGLIMGRKKVDVR